jgi:predicted nucleic acid-binding Zn ribbon protein
MIDVHKHCPVCGSPIPLEESTCSPKCQTVMDEQETKLKKSKKTLSIVMIVFLIVFAIMIFAPKF